MRHQGIIKRSCVDQGGRQGSGGEGERTLSAAPLNNEAPSGTVLLIENLRFDGAIYGSWLVASPFPPCASPPFPPGPPMPFSRS